MASRDDASYRLRLAQGFLGEARQDRELQRWRSCADNSQLAVENAAKAALATVGPVGRTHAPASFLREALKSGRFPRSFLAEVERLAEVAEQLGWDVHMESDYGDEIRRRTPWDIFDGDAADHALTLAEEAVGVAERVVAWPPKL